MGKILFSFLLLIIIQPLVFSADGENLIKSVGFVSAIEKQGDSKNDQLSVDDRKYAQPYGITFDDNLLYSIVNYKTVQIFEKNKTGVFKLKTKFDIPSTNPEQSSCQYIAVDSTNKNLFISNYIEHTIYIYSRTSSGAYVNTGKIKTDGLDLVNAVGAKGLTVDKSGLLYLVDSDNSVILVFKKNARGEYEFNNQFGSLGSGKKQFVFPSDIAMDKNNNFYITDTGNNRIQIWKREASGGYDFVSSFGSKGTAQGRFYGPNSIFIDKNNYIYISDTGNNRVQIFKQNADGEYDAIVRFGTYGTEYGKFGDPVGIAVDNDGLIYVADFYNDRIQIFTPEEKQVD